MPRFEKLMRKLQQHPDAIPYLTLKKILEHHGYQFTNRKGSHVRFQKDGFPSLTIPIHKQKVKKWYVKDILNQISTE